MSDTPRNPFTRAQITRAEFGYSGHSVIAPRGMKPEECLDPHMWSLVSESSRMKVYDEIRVVAEDCAWVQRLIVTFVKGSIVHVAQESVSELKAEKPAQPKPMPASERYKVEYRGPSARFCVIDTQAKTADKQRISQGHETKEDAEAELQKLLTPA